MDYDDECQSQVNMKTFVFLNFNFSILATHVVTSVTYGLGAIFNFMRTEQSGTYNTSVEASLKVQFHNFTSYTDQDHLCVLVGKYWLDPPVGNLRSEREICKD